MIMEERAETMKTPGSILWLDTILNEFMNPPLRKRERGSGKRQQLPDEQTGERQEQP